MSGALGHGAAHSRGRARAWAAARGGAAGAGAAAGPASLRASSASRQAPATVCRHSHAWPHASFAGVKHGRSCIPNFQVLLQVPESQSWEEGASGRPRSRGAEQTRQWPLRALAGRPGARHALQSCFQIRWWQKVTLVNRMKFFPLQPTSHWRTPWKRRQSPFIHL